jgi:hypothetical protein
MSRHPHTPASLSLLSRVRVERSARVERRALASELADYATPAQRDELEALIEANGVAEVEAARILRGQTQAQLFRVG